MKNINIENLLNEYSQDINQPPAYLKKNIDNKIYNIEINIKQKKDFVLFLILKEISKNKGIVFVGGVYTLLISIFIAIIFLNINNYQLNYTEFASSSYENKKINYINYNFQKSDTAIPIYLFYVDRPVNNNDENIYINGDNVNNLIINNTFMELDNSYNIIRVNSGKIFMELKDSGTIIAKENSILKIDTYYSKTDNVKDIYIKIDKGDIDVKLEKNTDKYDAYNYYIETPSSIINAIIDSDELSPHFSVSVFDNNNSIISIEKGTIEVFSNIRYTDEITDREIKLINEYVNHPIIMNKNSVELFLMEDALNYSHYINSNYKRLIEEYIE